VDLGRVGLERLPAAVALEPEAHGLQGSSRPHVRLAWATMRPLPLLLFVCSLVSTPTCRTVGDSPDAAPGPPARVLPAGWSTVAAWDFEGLIADLEFGPWLPTARAELVGALRWQDQRSLRAAVLLGHGGESSREALLTRLEERQLGSERHSDAADVVAAAALARWPAAAVAERLARLAVGSDPHPDLEVRAECGAVALDLGQVAAIPFLLRLLHAGTPAELQDPIDWPPTETLAWAKSRAAEALSRRAGVPCRFQTDGSYEHQMQAADELAAALGQVP